MDAFVTRKRRVPLDKLFTNDAFLLVSATGDDSSSGQTLSELIVANGGRVLTAADAIKSSNSSSSSSRVIVVLQHEQVNDLNAQDVEMLVQMLRRRDATALAVRAQWVRDSTVQQARLATHSYDVTRAVLALVKVGADDVNSGNHQTTTNTLEGESATTDSNKRRKVEPAAAFAPAARLTDLPRPHLTPWRDVDMGSLLILDAQSVDQQQQRSLQDNVTTPIKIAGFDMDGTWIATKSGKRFATDVHDWQWLHPTRVRSKLESLVRDGYDLVLFSNQNGIAKGNVTATEIQGKVETIIKKLNLPVLALLATKSDANRKPRLGGWRAMLAALNVTSARIDMAASFYCGDAAGRPKVPGRPKDFAATDYKFALNLGVRFLTPEALFFSSTQRVHTHPDLWDIGFDPRTLSASVSSDDAAPAALLTPATAALALPPTTCELVVFVGPPASGKSLFARTHFGRYVIVTQDELKTVAACKKRALEALAQATSVVVDATNRDVRTRGEWIAIAKQQGVPIRCIEMDMLKPLAMHLNTFRSLTEDKKIPDIAIHSFYKSFEPPQVAEGFAQVVRVHFQLASALAADKRELLCSFL